MQKNLKLRETISSGSVGDSLRSWFHVCMYCSKRVRNRETHSSLIRIVRKKNYFWVVTVTRLRDFELVSGCSDVGGMTSPPAGPHLAAHTWRPRRSKQGENIREVADKRPSADVWSGGGNVAMGWGKYWGLRGYTEAGVSQVWLRCGHQGWGPGPRWATSHRHLTWQHGTRLLQRYTPHQTSVSKQYRVTVFKLQPIFLYLLFEGQLVKARGHVTRDSPGCTARVTWLICNNCRLRGIQITAGVSQQSVVAVATFDQRTADADCADTQTWAI